MSITTENQEASNIVAMLDALASMSRGAVYVIDFRRKCFRYIGNHDLFLCGHSADEAMRLGYDFYPLIVHPDDMPLVKKIFLEILKAGCDAKQQNDLHYFSFTFRVKVYPQHGERPDWSTVCYKLVPVFADGQIRFGICLITCSETEKAEKEGYKNSNKGSGNLRLYYKNNEHFDEYSFGSGKWETYEIKHPTEIEKNMIILYLSGDDNELIAEKLHMPLSDMTRLYEKFGVRTMTQAVIHAINHSLIFRRSDDVPEPEKPTGNPEADNIFVMLEALASICRGAVYVFDFRQKRFRYIKNHDLFLCGHSVSEVMRAGRGFHSEFVHPDDMPPLKKIFRRILETCHNAERQNDIRYFSFTLRSRIYPQLGEQPDYVMTCHKFTPVFADGRIRYGICLITCSAKEKAGENSNKGTGNLRLYYKDNDRYDEYSFERHKWDAHKIEYPTKIEKIVLIMSMSGESGRSIAVKLCMSYDKLRHILTGLYEKLGVRTMRQALIHSMNHSLLFRHSDNDDVPKPENRKLKKNKQQWNRLTSEVSQRIQACSDKGQSIRSIAKEVGISEGAIRKAIKNNRLTKE